MSLSFGSCTCCGKTFGFEKINLCKDCEKKYIEDIKKYVRENGKIGQNGRKTVEVEEIKEKLGISNRVITYFAEDGILDLIFNGEDINEKVEDKPKQDDRIAKLNALKNSIQSEMQKQQPENKPTGPRMHTHNPIKK